MIIARFLTGLCPARPAFKSPQGSDRGPWTNIDAPEAGPAARPAS